MTEQAKCPECGSENVVSSQTTFHIMTGISGALILAILAGLFSNFIYPKATIFVIIGGVVIGLLLGFIGARKKYVSCKDCGRKWNQQNIVSDRKI